MKQGQALLAKNDVRSLQQAFAIFVELVDHAPTNAVAWLQLGKVIDDLDQQEADLDELLATVPAKQRRELTAFKCWDRALALDPNLAEAWRRKVDLHEARDESKKQLACIEQAVSCDPQDAESWAKLGVVLQEQAVSGSFFDRLKVRKAEAMKRAVEAHDRVIALAPTVARMYGSFVFRAECSYLEGNPAGAVALLDRHLSLKGESDISTADVREIRKQLAQEIAGGKR